ncbi:MAG: hypothetical protein ACPGLV_05725, partial [Bacteroidia bacterium]
MKNLTSLLLLFALIQFVFTACDNDYKKWKKGYSSGVSDTFISRGKVGQKVYNTMERDVFGVMDTFENGLLKVGRLNVSLSGSKSGSVSIRKGNFKWFGAINKDSQFVVPCLFDEIRYLSDTLFSVRYRIYFSQHDGRNLWAVISSRSKFLTDFDYQRIWINDENVIMAINLDG